MVLEDISGTQMRFEGGGIVGAYRAYATWDHHIPPAAPVLGMGNLVQ